MDCVSEFFERHAVQRQKIDVSRLLSVSQYFLSCPYVLNPLGDGPLDLFDQRPYYRLDAFDCVTYVNMVLALSLSRDQDEFLQYAAKVNYASGDLSYASRHHFMSVDWNTQNQQLGIVKDITADVLPGFTQVAHAMIDKPKWYRHKTCADLHLSSLLAPEAMQRRLDQLHALADQVALVESHLDYVPLDILLQPKHWLDFVDALPAACVVEIVRPNWDLRESIGTHLNVSHVGFAFKQADDVIFLHASQDQGAVVSCNLQDYLMKYVKHPHIKGINVQQIMI